MLLLGLLLLLNDENTECCDAESDASRVSDRVLGYAKPSLLQRSFNPETVTVHSEANMYMCVFVCLYAEAVSRSNACVRS